MLLKGRKKSQLANEGIILYEIGQVCLSSKQATYEKKREVTTIENRHVLSLCIPTESRKVDLLLDSCHQQSWNLKWTDCVYVRSHLRLSCVRYSPHGCRRF